MPIVEEITEYFGSEQSILEPLVFYPVGSSSSEEKSLLKKWIYNAIENDPSFGVVGVYSLGNIESRPHKYYAIIGSFEHGILLNVDPDRNWMITINYNAHEAHFKELEQLISHISSIFLFVSSQRLVSLGKKLYNDKKLSRSLYNNVYQLKNFNESLISDCNPSAKVIYHPSTQENFLKVREFYEYQENHMDELSGMQVILELDNELVAGARANEEIDNSCVIGGVKTLPHRRKQKLGFTVCFHLTKLLHQKYENVFLETDMDNFPAIKIYKKLGFIEVGVSAFFEKGLDMIEDVIGERDY